jgi:hypothetical protein
MPRKRFNAQYNACHQRTKPTSVWVLERPGDKMPVIGRWTQKKGFLAHCVHRRRFLNERGFIGRRHSSRAAT